MNGLTQVERRHLDKIRRLAVTDLGAAKREAVDWIRASQRRRVIRQAACRTVKGLYGHRPR